MPDQMRMSMPGGNRCSGWAVTAVDALARDVPLSARGRGCRAVPARVAARVPRRVKGWFIWNTYLLYPLPSIHMDDPVYH